MKWTTDIAFLSSCLVSTLQKIQCERLKTQDVYQLFSSKFLPQGKTILAMNKLKKFIDGHRLGMQFYFVFRAFLAF